jgi:hypothetical protein
LRRLESDVNLGRANGHHKTQTVPFSNALDVLATGGELHGWDDPNLEITITEVAEKITIDVNAFMAYLALYRELDENLRQTDVAVAYPIEAASIHGRGATAG